MARLEVLRDLDSQRLTAAAAAQLLGVGRQQTRRLLKALRTCGVEGLISKQRGRPTNRRKPDDVLGVVRYGGPLIFQNMFKKEQ